MSEEGASQGDPLAMYAVSTQDKIELLKERVPEAKQVWFADDSAAGAKLEAPHEWWVQLNFVGPPRGYYPKPEKTWVIVKRPELIG